MNYHYSKHYANVGLTQSKNTSESNFDQKMLQETSYYTNVLLEFIEDNCEKLTTEQE